MMRHMFRAFLFILISATGLMAAETNHRISKSLEGVIIRVEAAQNLVLWHKGELVPFTLYGIQLPDLGTPKGQKAKKTVSDLIFNTLLTVHLIPDENNSPKGIVVIRGHCMNETLVKKGVARVAESCEIAEYCEKWQIAQP